MILKLGLYSIILSLETYQMHTLPPGSGLRLKLWVISWRCHRIWNLDPRCRHQRTECHLFGNSG
jgi:hypothetical protein